ncbi:MAG TPA: hypothetical protein VHC96_14290 [Puia sp.]|nr:hypothetical protein [Puia sp.]
MMNSIQLLKGDITKMEVWKNAGAASSMKVWQGALRRPQVGCPKDHH